MSNHPKTDNGYKLVVYSPFTYGTIKRGFVKCLKSYCYFTRTSFERVLSKNELQIFHSSTLVKRFRVCIKARFVNRVPKLGKVCSRTRVNLFSGLWKIRRALLRVAWYWRQKKKEEENLFERDYRSICAYVKAFKKNITYRKRAIWKEDFPWNWYINVPKFSSSYE